MRPLVLAVLAFGGWISTASTFETPKIKYPYQSAPFNLIVLSSNSTLNGTHLYSCHEGAAIQGLCTNSSRHIREGPNPRPIEPYNMRYFLNYTDGSEGERSPTKEARSGILTWAFEHMTVSCAMKLRNGWNGFCSNVITPLFTPGDHNSDIVAFDGDNKLCIWNWRDEAVLPTWQNRNYEQTAYYNWYICMTNVGYLFETLTWVSGGEPVNPSCQKVDILRVPEGSHS
ncbi:hypothetical protein IFR05_003755 [Cadophora sp. M221]|nr:hypothetical protein IFR05_003755 [Cadophora sp. M221]